MKKVLISGTSSGLGLETALALQDTYNVTGFARKPLPEEITELSRFTHFSNIDIRTAVNSAKIQSAISESDILINNAGLAYDGLLATQAPEDIETVIDVNLVSSIKLTKFFAREKLKQRKPGLILNISSIIGIRGYAGLVAYSASKAGLDAVTRSLAREMGPKGIRINSLLPGYFDSELSSSLSPEQRSQIIRRTPLGRLATSQDLIPVIKFLISDDAAFVTGQCIVVDGGITV